MLLLDHNNAFLFLEQCQLGNIAWTGTEPPVSLLIDGQVDFEIQRSKIRFSHAYGHKLLSSLADLYSNQQMFLGSTNFTIFRKLPLITKFETNLRALEIAESNEHSEPQNTVVFGGGCPIETKLTHSSHLLLQDGFVNMRNRSLTLSQCFSISRFQEISFWKISDLVHFYYSQHVPRLNRQKIRVLLVEQRRHKTKKSSEPDLKVLIRHRDGMLCPLGAISLFMYIRFNILHESPIDFLDPSEQWKKKMLFRTTNDPNQSVSASTSYSQKRAFMESTGTKVSHKCNHIERHQGALIASMNGLGSDQIEKIGLWNSRSSTSHYEKYLCPSSLAQLSGFGGVEDYYLERATKSIERFCQVNPDSTDFFRAFMPCLDDPRVKDAIASSQGRANSLKNTFQALLFLKEIFYQDIGVIWKANPNSIIFKSDGFVRNWSVFNKWLTYIQEEEVEEVTTPHRDIAPVVDPRVDNALAEIKDDIRQLMASDSLQSSQLHRIIHHLEFGKQETINQEKENHPRKKHKASHDENHGNKEDSSSPIIKEMRQLNEMKFSDLLREWYEGFVLNDRRYPSLKELEKRRTARKEKYYESNLKTTIARRRQLIEYFEITCEKLGSKEKAQAFIEEEQRDRKLTTLYKLWKWTRKQQKNDS